MPEEANRKIKVALQRIKEAQKGFSLSGEDAVAGKLLMVFQAFNKCASATGLNIESINITDKSVAINGDTSGPDSTLKVFEALKQAGVRESDIVVYDASRWVSDTIFLPVHAEFPGIRFEDLIEFYQHGANWSNRMSLGDSLLVMTSMAEKEGLKGQVQMFYFDPPKTGKIAVKVINHYGDEVLKVYEVG
jgi:hypothetical protein